MPPREKTPLVVVFPTLALSHFPFSPVLELSQRGKKIAEGILGAGCMGEGIQLQLFVCPKLLANKEPTASERVVLGETTKQQSYSAIKDWMGKPNQKREKLESQGGFI